MKNQNQIILSAAICTLIVTLISIFLISSALADFELGELAYVSGDARITIDEGYKIDAKYGPGGTLSGRINLSLDDEPFDSLFAADFGSEGDEIALKDFLENAGVSYECSPFGFGCEIYYAASGSGAESKTLQLASGEKKIIGLKLSGSDVDDVTSFSISISSNAGASCSNPLKIDIGNDDSYEWIAHDAAGGEFCSEKYGCYDAADKDTNAVIGSTAYCNRINISSAPNIKIGADLVRFDNDGKSHGFVMSISNADFDESCDINSVSNSGKYSCTVDISTAEEQEFDVCISAKNSEDCDKYEIGMEDIEPCGYAGSSKKDFAIFASPGKYSQIEDFEINTAELESFEPSLGENTDMESYIADYIHDTYGGDCSGTDGCIVPIRFAAGSDASQQITVSGISIVYKSGETSLSSKKVYDVTEKSSRISMDFTGLNLAAANLNVPKKYGEYDLMLLLGGEDLLESELEIEVVKAPIIELVYPQKVPADIDTLFKIYTSGSNATKFKWSFGDNSSEQETTKNTIIHKYSDVGTYTLTVSAENSLGTTMKSYTIEVVSPSDYTGDVIRTSQADIDKVRNQISLLPSWMQTYLNAQLNLNSKEAELNTLKAQHEASGGSTSENEEIINAIEELDIPSALEVTDSSSVQYFVDRQQANFADMVLFGAGELSIESDSAAKNALFAWFTGNMNVLLEEKVYSVYVDGMPEPVASKLKFIVNPKQDAEITEYYFVVNTAKSNIAFGEGLPSVQETGAGETAATALNFPSISSKEIELVLPEKVDIFEIPAYFCPPLSKLSEYLADVALDVCDNDRSCEKDAGETWKNCRDCRPWGWVLFWLLLLLLIAFAVYIALQEWYKRKYESHLFKNKHDLYNLVNFMDNAEKQGMAREDMFKKLREKGWTHEQIVYAWRKYKGLRTGMWEIPIFKPFEKMQLRKEVNKLRASGHTGKIAPIPNSIPRMSQLKPINMPRSQNINK